MVEENERNCNNFNTHKTLTFKSQPSAYGNEEAGSDRDKVGGRDEAQWLPFVSVSAGEEEGEGEKEEEEIKQNGWRQKFRTDHEVKGRSNKENDVARENHG